MREFDDTDDYYEWVEEIASNLEVPYYRHAAKTCITAIAHIGEEVTLYTAADPFTKLRAYPADVLRLTEQDWHQFSNTNSYRDLAVLTLAADIEEAN